MACGKIIFDKAGQPVWATIEFSDSIILSTQTYWVVIKAASGAAVWITKPGAVPLRVLEQRVNKNLWTELSVHDDHEGLLQFFSRSNRAKARTTSTLSISDEIILPESEQNGSKVFDLANTISNYIAVRPPTIPTVAITLSFKAVGPGIITVYPPKIEISI